MPKTKQCRCGAAAVWAPTSWGSGVGASLCTAGRQKHLRVTGQWHRAGMHLFTGMGYADWMYDKAAQHV